MVHTGMLSEAMRLPADADHLSYSQQRRIPPGPEERLWRLTGADKRPKLMREVKIGIGILAVQPIERMLMQNQPAPCQPNDEQANHSQSVNLTTLPLSNRMDIIAF